MIKDSFDFKTKHNPRLVYSANLSSTGQFEVTWKGSDGSCVYSERYSKDTVLKHLLNEDWVEVKPEFKSISIETKSEQVHSPKHYNVLEDIEAIQIIAGSMSQEMFKGYCLGNILKYRLRCGAKDDVNQELAKADKYKELFAKYKHLCKEDK